MVPNGFALVAANWTASVGAPGWPGMGYSSVIDRQGRVRAQVPGDADRTAAVADLPAGPPLLTGAR